MSLILCPECKQEISRTVKRCPHCGYKLPSNAGKLWFIILLLIVLIIFLLSKLSDNSTSENIIENKNTYTMNWRNPSSSETRDISKIMISKNVSGCGEYYVKRVSEGEYIVACTEDGENWNYYIVYTMVGTIYRANDDMLKKINPPR